MNANISMAELIRACKGLSHYKARMIYGIRRTRYDALRNGRPSRPGRPVNQHLCTRVTKSISESPDLASEKHQYLLKKFWQCKNTVKERKT